MTGAILWPHIGGGGCSPHLAVLRRWQPGGALILDPDADDVRAFRQAVPGAVVVGRIWREDAEVRGRILADPLGAAAWADDLVLRHPARGLVDYWQIANEVCQQDWEEFQRLVEFECARARLAARHAYLLAMFGFSVGNPDLPGHDRLAYWRATYPALDLCAADGHVVLTHQYGWERNSPSLWGPVEKGGSAWMINRLEQQVLPRLPSRYQDVRFVDGEYGLDGHVLEPGFVGWQGRLDAGEYVRQLTEMSKYLEQFRGRVLGHAVFTLGHNAPWGTYDIAGPVAEGLATFFERQRGAGDEPVKPDTGGKVAELKVSDGAGTHDAAWLKTNYGTEFVPASPQAKRLALAEVRITEGPAAAVVEVYDGAGKPLQDVAVAFAWPDAPHDLTGDAAKAFKTRYAGRADVQWTDGNGQTGFGLGLGAYITDLRVGGPHSLWLLHHEYESDVLARVGMLAGTDHRGPLRLVFRLAEASEATKPVEPEKPPVVVATGPGPFLVWPVRGPWTITQFFGEDKADYSRYGLIHHNGIDLAGQPGTPIVAAHDGTAWVYDDPGYGRTVEVWAPAINNQAQYKTIYAHLDSRAVVHGQRVAAGQVIGGMGSTGNSTGPHLHFGIKWLYRGGRAARNPGYRDWCDPWPHLKGA